MIEVSDVDTPENNILYELLIYTEWQQEFETPVRGNDKTDEGVETGYIQKLLGPLALESCPPYWLRCLTSLQMPWTFAVGGNGAVIAILQDAALEIRTSRDEYGAVIGRTSVNKDPYPEWRRILWSPDCTMLVLAHSSGNLDFYDLIGALMFTIESPRTTPDTDKVDLRFAIAGMSFSDVRTKSTQWSYEFLFANYEGTIYGYFISPSDGYKKSHTFSLSSCYPLGITCFLYHPDDNILIVCGKSYKLSSLSTFSDSSQMGLSVWRVLSDSPYYKLALSVEELTTYSKANWWTLLSQHNVYRKSAQDLVFKMSISPNGNILAAVHASGALSLWDLPSLRLKKYWPLKLQPNYADINPQYCEPGMKKKVDCLLSDAYYSHIIDINWWSDDAIIMVRRCGAVTVSSISSLRNLLGISPEWFEPSAAVTSFCDRGFLSIECETRMKSKRKAPREGEYEEEESSEDDEPSVFARSAELAQKALYFVTDSDRFRPPRKKMRMVSKTYRLLCLKSTTPEELYTRKINNEEYGEALALAKTYNLDCDLVYQRQWRKMPATVESINDYLSKITKRSWVLHECMERVPESFEAAKELLMYGLQGTDLKALIAIGKNEDRGRFILCSMFDDVPDAHDIPVSYDMNLEEQDIYEAKQILQQKRRNELLKQINFKKLTLEQKQLCECRLKLLNYLDRLMTYEIILGGPLLADEHYDPTFFKKFRTQCGLEAATYFACNSNWQAIATLFTYHGSETLPHRLAILSNFPETTSPADYQSLLPLYNVHQSEFYSWHEDKHREQDWCEKKYQKNIVVRPTDEFTEEFYEKYPELLKYRESDTNSVVVTEWFLNRAKEIEERTGLVSDALELIKLGMQRNIQGLEKLHDDLMTLEILIYECLIKQDLSLKEYVGFSESDKVKLLMSTTAKDHFIKSMQQWLLPFLNCCDKHEPGSGKSLLKNYILSVSKTDLFYCETLLENSKLNLLPILSDVNELISLALDCVYYTERTDQIQSAKNIYELLSSLTEQPVKNLTEEEQNLQTSIENLRKHIDVADLLDKNGLSVTLAMIQNISDNSEEVKKLLVKLTRMSSHRFPRLDEAEWTSLLSDILEMHHILFKCVSMEECYEIVLQSILCSGKVENIAFAGRMMECNKKQRREKEVVGSYKFRLPYKKAVNLVLKASQEYFNSSANATDPCMSLARTCLNLMEDVPASIEEEADLISSISLLQDFNINILPLQVRLCQNRISLIQEVLCRNEKSYKKSQKIMKLAYLLRSWSCNKHEREGKVLTLIGERAFQVNDYNECLLACKSLMEGVHEEGWLICYTLGSCNKFSDLRERCNLLSFALAYCSDDLMETILQRKTELHLQLLQERVKYLLGDDSVQLSVTVPETLVPSQSEADINGISSLWPTSEKTFAVLQNTTQATKTVLSSVKNPQFWKDAVSWIQPLKLSWSEGNSDCAENSNINLSKQGVCAFYDGLVENAHISSLESNYQRYARPDLNRSQDITSCILRACLLEDSLKLESSNFSIDVPVLLDMAKAYISEDMLHCLCILLSLKEAEEAESIFKTLPNTPLLLQFASLYYALKVLVENKIKIFSNNNDIEADPSSIIKRALKMKNSDVIPGKEKISDTLFTLLKKYNKMLYDFIQGEILHSIGGGVDATRFTTDDAYKKDTILGISMSLDDSVFQTAVSLAHHYNISVWDLYFTHLEYLFSESSVSAAVTSERVEKHKILDKLLEKKEMLENRLRNSIYPSIHGQNHEKLLVYFSLLEKCGDNEDSFKIKPSVHKKLLNKFKAAHKSIDYKLIMSPETMNSYLATIINESSVHVFAKAADEGIDFYDAGKIYCIWAQKYFFEGNSAHSKVPVTKTEWIHRFESCSDILQRLGPSDMLIFVDNVIFSNKALERMTIDCRSEIIKRTIKFCRKKSMKHKNEPDKSFEWNQVVLNLNSYQQHLQRLEDETFVKLRESFDPNIIQYCHDFDVSKSSTESLQHLLVQIVLEGPNLQLLKNFLSCCPEDIGWEPSDAYIKAIYVVLLQMKQPQNATFACFKTDTPVHILEKILDEISQEKEELMIEDMAVEILNEFCHDADVSVPVRLNILQLLEKTGCLSPEYKELLLLYRTQAIISSMWPDVEVSEDEVKEEPKRKELLDKLLYMSRTINHFVSVGELLHCWPGFSLNLYQNCDEPWTELLCRLISLSNKDALESATNLLSMALIAPSFTEQCCKEVFEKVRKQGHILYILKFALKTNYGHLHSEALYILRENPEVKEEDYDAELLELILLHRLTAQIISTGLYKPAIEFLLHCQDDNIENSYKSIDSVVTELHAAGYDFEAGSLLHIKSSTHMGLSTFSSAINVLQRWLSATKS